MLDAQVLAGVLAADIPSSFEFGRGTMSGHLRFRFSSTSPLAAAPAITALAAAPIITALAVASFVTALASAPVNAALAAVFALLRFINGRKDWTTFTF